MPVFLDDLPGHYAVEPIGPIKECRCQVLVCIRVVFIRFVIDARYVYWSSTCWNVRNSSLLMIRKRSLRYRYLVMFLQKIAWFSCLFAYLAFPFGSSYTSAVVRLERLIEHRTVEAELYKLGLYAEMFCVWVWT